MGPAPQNLTWVTSLNPGVLLCSPVVSLWPSLGPGTRACKPWDPVLSPRGPTHRCTIYTALHFYFFKKISIPTIWILFYLNLNMTCEQNRICGVGKPVAWQDSSIRRIEIRWPRRHTLGMPGAVMSLGASSLKAGSRGQKYYSEENYPPNRNKSMLHTGALSSSGSKLF